MEIETTETTETTTPVETQTTEVVAEATGHDAQEVIEAAREVATEAPAVEEWKPSYKYKVKDDLFDMEEWVKPLVKSKDIEEKLKVLFSKGHGIEDIKSERTKLRETSKQIAEKYEATTGELNSIRESLDMVSGFVNSGNIDMFMEALRLPEDKFLQWAVEKIKFRQLPPEEKARIESEKYQQKRIQEMEWQNQQLMQQNTQAVVNQRLFELDNALANQSVAQIVNEYDARAGRPGAFKEQVVMIGNYYDTSYGQDLTVAEAVQKAVQMYGGILGNLGTQNTNQQQTGTSVQATTQNVQNQKPVIPNIRGRGTSPVKVAPTSISDLQKIRDQMLASE